MRCGACEKELTLTSRSSLKVGPESVVLRCYGCGKEWLANAEDWRAEQKLKKSFIYVLREKVKTFNLT